MPTTLDILKFVCKDFWIAIWEKQVDGLRTNHRGVYVLTDNAFKPLINMSTAQGSLALSKAIKLHLPHSVGLLKGALSRMGVSASVVAESVAASQEQAGFQAGNKPLPIADAGVAGEGTAGAASSPSDNRNAAVTFHVRTAAATGTVSNR